MMAVERTPILRKFPKLSLPLNAFFCFTSFVFGLPLAIALFPQEGAMHVTALEPELQQLKTTDGAPVTHLFYHKGL